jgi:hypothetical protein
LIHTDFIPAVFTAPRIIVAYTIFYRGKFASQAAPLDTAGTLVRVCAELGVVANQVSDTLSTGPPTPIVAALGSGTVGNARICVA